MINLDDDESSILACDKYVVRYCRTKHGDIYFIEIANDKNGPWTLWRSELVFISRNLGILSYMVIVEDADKEIHLNWKKVTYTIS